MRKAALVLATSVAFLLSADAFAARKDVAHPPVSDVIASGTASKNGTSLDIAAAISGVLIESSRGALTVPVQSITSVPQSNIVSLVKGTLKNTPATALTTVAFVALLEAVDWVIEGEVISKEVNGAPVLGSASTDYYWIGSGTTKYSDPSSACSTIHPHYSFSRFEFFTYSGQLRAHCYYTGFSSPLATAYRYGSTCPTGTTYNTTAGGCIGQTRVPLTSADIDNSTALDDFIKNSPVSLQKDLIKESCQVKAQPKDCYDSLPDRRRLDGPDSIDLPDLDFSTTEITLNGDTNTTTTNNKSEVSIQYNDNSIEYTENQTTTTTNSNGTTTTKTETVTVPTLPLLSIEPWTDVPADISGTSGGLSFLPYSPTFSMGGGGCSEWTFQLPVIGNLTTNYCPIHEQYVRPTLAFFFYLWTVLHIFHIARETTQIVRAK
ncbi:hypothetical protein LX59_01112 [Azomonas agilis]|uniref:Uncharacterized protein n=1 Tax=Azomonas agilis TaxID=116849 RepID=A0A562IZ75_9GAMM|nr:hypothetical protein [Azomonas agilis]TWH76192.1 hypothetical protein LX59_01112 [Azomonas agilis]